MKITSYGNEHNQNGWCRYLWSSQDEFVILGEKSIFEFAYQRHLMTLKLDADVCLIWERRYLLSFSALIYDQVLSH